MFRSIRIFLCFRLFTKMPSNHYMDEAQLLLSVGSDDISDSDKIRTAIKVETRMRDLFHGKSLWK